MKTATKTLIIGDRQSGRSISLAHHLDSLLTDKSFQTQDEKLILMLVPQIPNSGFWQYLCSCITDPNGHGDGWTPAELTVTALEHCGYTVLICRDKEELDDCVSSYPGKSQFAKKVIVIDDDQAKDYFDNNDFYVIKTKLKESGEVHDTADVVVNSSIEYVNGQFNSIFNQYLKAPNLLQGAGIRILPK